MSILKVTFVAWSSYSRAMVFKFSYFLDNKCYIFNKELLQLQEGVVQAFDIEMMRHMFSILKVLIV